MAAVDAGPGSAARRLAALGAFCAKHARAVIAAWAVVIVAAAVAAHRAPEMLFSGAGDIPDSPSLRVDELLRKEFPNPRSHLLILALRSASLEREPGAVDALVESLRDRWEKDPLVAEVIVEEDIPNRRLRPAKGTGHIVIVSAKADNTREAERAVPRIRAVAEPLLTAAKALHPDLEWAITGRAALTYDLSLFDAQDTKNAELRALPLTLIVLVFAFGSLVAATVPVIVGLAGMALTLGTVWILAHAFVISDLVESVASMIGLALGIDYSLFLLYRYRQEAQRDGDGGNAIERAMAGAGPVILYSGLTVLIGMAGLVATPLVQTRSIGLGGCLVVAMTVLLALTLLPAILSIAGSARLEWPRFLSSRLQGRGRERWERWANLVTRHPVVAAVAGVATLLLLAAPGLQTRFGFPEADFLPQELEYARGLKMLERMSLQGLVLPLPIVLTDTAGGRALTDERVPELLAFAGRLRRDPCVSIVLGPIDVIDSQYVSRDQRRILMHVIARDCRLQDLKALARAIPSWLEIPGLKAEVGGQAQYYNDIDDSMKTTYALSIGFVLAATSALLLAAFRAPLVAVKALVLNALSVLAGYGVVVYVFQLGHGSAWLGVHAPTEATPVTVPLMIFCIVFGLSMDYEMFLLSRARTAYLRTGDNTASVREALADTGAVITSAALIMVVVFGAFAFARVVLVQMIGLGLAVAVLVDATIIRSLLGPALMQVAGRWNWWPHAARQAPHGIVG
jgi:RND superfamily putative drug exporter